MSIKQRPLISYAISVERNTSKFRSPLKTQWEGSLAYAELRYEGRGLRKTTCNLLIKPLPSGKKLKLGTLKTSGARFLEVP
jgi:hypothetical protein